MITDRLKNITTIPENYLINNPPAPKSVKIELSSKCNYRCQFCSISDRLSIPKEMEWKLFVKIVNELKEYGVEEIGLFLIGEPFISPKLLIRAIYYLKNIINIPYVFITSNASLATPQYVEECMKAGLDSLKWSCNVADEEQFSKLINIAPKWFYKTQENIKNAFKLRQLNNYPTKLYASSIYYDEDQVMLMQKFLQDHILSYVDEHYWLPLYTMGGSAIERENNLGYIPIAGNSGALKYPVSPIPCWAVFTAGHILVDGTVSACCADSTGKWAMGNMQTQTFGAIWQSEEFQKLRNAHLNKNVIGSKCEKCILHY